MSCVVVCCIAQKEQGIQKDIGMQKAMLGSLHVFSYIVDFMKIYRSLYT